MDRYIHIAQFNRYTASTNNFILRKNGFTVINLIMFIVTSLIIICKPGKCMAIIIAFHFRDFLFDLTRLKMRPEIFADY